MRKALFLVLGLTAGLSQAQWDSQEWIGTNKDIDDEAKAWQEVDPVLPAAPSSGNLVEIQVSPATTHRFMVDRDSLNATPDGVVHYTMVIKTAGGGANVTFEGMRCATGETKIYAFGQADGTWSPNRFAKWSLIRAREQTNYQRVLFYHYFCTVEGPAEMKSILQNLRKGGLYRN